MRASASARVSLPVQLGGAAGTLASLGPEGGRVVGLLAKRLELDEPTLPWHTARLRVADLAASLGLAAGVLEKIALDLVLLSQTEVGEVAESSGERPRRILDPAAQAKSGRLGAGDRLREACPRGRRRGARGDAAGARAGGGGLAVRVGARSARPLP